jgi:histidinol-phosphate aminotransferase
MIEPRRAVRNMASYSPPTGGRVDKLRLDFNENTVGCSPKVIERLREYLSTDAVSIYPEYRDSIATLARFFDVGADELTLTNGTDEAIQLLLNTFVDAGDEVLLMRPSYAMYRFYGELAGAAVREIDYEIDGNSDRGLPLEKLLAGIRPNTRAILIANPNNPTGSAVGQDEIGAILRAAPRAAVLIDEAYFEFFGISVLGWIRDQPNLFVSRTFSKAYGMAALRCGCLFSRTGNMNWIRKAQSPYSVNMAAAVAACAAVEDTEYRETYVGEILAARKLALDGLRALGIRCFPAFGNFILFHAGDRAIPIRDALRERGVLVRDRSYEIPGCVRVTIGTREQVRRFLNELETLWTR